MHLLLNKQRRRMDDEVGPVLLVLPAPYDLRVEVPIPPLVRHPQRRLLLGPHDRLQLRGRNVLPRRLGVLEGDDGLRLVLVRSLDPTARHYAASSSAASTPRSNSSSSSG